MASAEFRQLHPWGGHGVNAPAQVETDAINLSEMGYEDRPIKAVEIVGHQNMLVQLGGPRAPAICSNDGASLTSSLSMPCT